MRPIGIVFGTSLLTFTMAHAGGWNSVHRYVKPSGKCAGQEVLASTYERRSIRREWQHRGRSHLASWHDIDLDEP